jgi:hypothetical protein
MAGSSARPHRLAFEAYGTARPQPRPQALADEGRVHRVMGRPRNRVFTACARAVVTIARLSQSRDPRAARKG